ncbi:hypothetical protein [Collimonas sp. PA-H2]|uniref:hypothetical protein n=1 Tax=Collimonas sp. PA-H2 TaxID=1881062 RepID=UPI000BF60A30|nr:hypothetical protein [Collimonas sp. PA-H2]
MKTHFSSSDKTPDFDSKIADWISAFSMETFGGPPHRVGILSDIEGTKVVYRAIDGDGMEEITAVYDFLKTLSLVDFGIHTHPRFNTIYGLPEHRPAVGTAYVVRCFE